MKKHFILAAMAATTLFTACSNEEEEPLLQSEKQVTFTIGQTVTRTSTNASTGVTSFQENDEIAIYSDGLATDMEGEVFVVGSNGELSPKTEGDSFIYDGENGASFYAYYPTSATGSVTNVSFTISPDQSANQAFGLSDFMTATTTVSAAQETAVELQFAHRLTLIKVELSAIDNVTEVLINNVKPTATWTYAGDAVVTSGTATSVKMGQNENVADKVEYWAVIPAQELAASTMLFTITARGKTYSYTPSNAITLTAGGAKRFKLAIGEDGTLVSLSTSLEATWGEETGDEEGNLTEEDTKNYLITPSAGLFSVTNVPTSIDGWSLSNISQEETWYYSTKGNTNASCTYNEENAGIAITNFSTSWWNEFIVYRLDDEKIKNSTSKQFTLSLKATTTETTETKLYVTVARITKSLYYDDSAALKTKIQQFKIDSSWSKTANLVGLTDGVVSCTVDFAKIHRGQGTDTNGYSDIEKQTAITLTEADATDDDYSDVILVIGASNGNTSSATYTKSMYINNITLLEKETTE